MGNRSTQGGVVGTQVLYSITRFLMLGNSQVISLSPQLLLPQNKEHLGVISKCEVAQEGQIPFPAKGQGSSTVAAASPGPRVPITLPTSPLPSPNPRHPLRIPIALPVSPSSSPHPHHPPRIPVALPVLCWHRGQSDAKGKGRIREKRLSEKLLGGKKSIVKKRRRQSGGCGPFPRCNPTPVISGGIGSSWVQIYLCQGAAAQIA